MSLVLPAREINILNEATSDRASKKGALEKILKQLQGIKDGKEVDAFAAALLKPLLRAVVDPIEKCRELSMAIIELVVANSQSAHPLLTDLIPLFSARLAQVKILEQSEEIRLSMIKTLNLLVKRSGEGFGPFVEDVVGILARTTLDTFQDIRKESFLLIISLCKQTPRDLAHHGGAVVKLILPSLSHRHSSVRTFALQALTQAMIVDAAAIDDAIEPLRTLTRDKAPAVRETLYTLARDWLTLLMDRHVYGVKILPLLYAGLTDETPKLVELSYTYMDQVGAQYEKENNDRIKDELDYSDGISRPNRPRSGCRHLARDNIQKIMGRQIELLGDWNVDTRFKAAQVLTVFMDFAETNATGYIGALLPAVYKVLAGDEPHVMQQNIALMEKVGEFVSPETTLQLLMPALSSGGGGLSTFRIGCLRALQGILKGTPGPQLEPFLVRLLACLSEKDLLLNESIHVMTEVSNCLLQIGQKLTREEDVLFSYFTILVQLESIPGNEKTAGWSELQASVRQAFEEHAKYLGVSIDMIYSTHLDASLLLLAKTYPTWSQYSAEPRVLQTLLFKTGARFVEKMDVLLPIFVECVAKEKDHDLREKILQIQLHLYKHYAVPKSLLGPFMPVILQDVILKSCIWKAGRKSVIIRNLATELFRVLCGLFAPSEAVEWIQPLFDSDIVPILASNLDDDEQSTRQHCLAILDFVFQAPVWNAEAYKKVYPELLKRMDDAKDEVRIQTAQVWERFFYSVQSWLASLAPLKETLPPQDRDKLTVLHDGQLLEIGLESGHYETILDGLLVHMDDTNHLVQEAVCNALVAGKATVLEGGLVRERVQLCRTKHRSSVYLEKLY
ncbi:HEAT repeat-containing protein 2 [Kappamyces sp. JEL0680]|nr:HEAT repeat-containing protein 2 [Kappamyces sp. JEL0680]